MSTLTVIPSQSIAKHTVRASVVFEYEDGSAVNPDPDAEIVFTVYGQDQSTVRHTETQALADATAPGTFEFYFTPTVVEAVYVEALTTIGSRQQAGRITHQVVWTT